MYPPPLREKGAKKKLKFKLAILRRLFPIACSHHLQIRSPWQITFRATHNTGLSSILYCQQNRAQSAPQSKIIELSQDRVSRPLRTVLQRQLAARIAAHLPRKMGPGVTRRVYPVNTLNPYLGNWLIKVRVTSKGPLRSYSNARGNGNVFTVEFTDEDGTEIQATMWKEAADKFFQIFHMGKVYYVSKGVLKAANRQYTAVKNEYEMTIGPNAEVEEVKEAEEKLSKIPTMVYHFVKLEELGPHVGGKALVDVVGVVQSVSGILTVRRKSNGDEIPKREVVLADEGNKSVVVTLWDQLASGMGAELERRAEEHPVLAVKQLRVGEYGGVSLSTTARSQLEINPQLPAAEALREWYDTDGKGAVLEPAGASMPGGGIKTGGRSVYTDRISLEDITDPSVGDGKAAYFNARLLLSMVRPDQNLFYNACTKCNRKVTEAMGTFYCEGCSQPYETCSKRYILSATAMDSTGEAWVSAFNEQAEQILGVGAEALSDLKEKNDGEFKRVLREAMWKPYVVRLQATVSEYQNKKRQRIKVASLHAVDYAAENKLLLEQIVTVKRET